LRVLTILRLRLRRRDRRWIDGHYPVEHLMGPAMLGLADHLGVQGAG
jgi:hypothetical protein